MLEIDVVINDS